LKPPASILVIVTRRIGDVLLATPLVHSLKQAWPDAAIDALVFSGTEGILAANPDLRRVIAVPENAKDPSHPGILLRLARRYDLAVSTLPGDRPTFYAWLAGRRRIGFILSGKKHFWKRLLLSEGMPFDAKSTHTVLMNLALADLLGIPRSYNVVVRWEEADKKRVERLLPLVAAAPYAVMHSYPKYPYKMWRRDGWLETARWLRARGIATVLTGGPDAQELASIEGLQREMPPGTKNIAGRLSFTELAFLISRAALYVGPDTVVTHMAAALGTATVALYGPTSPVKWGPWPQGYAGNDNPFSLRGSQRVNNVTLLQGPGDCVPCLEEGCDRHVASHSDCLLKLPPAQVIAALASMVASAQGPS
jgi:heptosyltransferase-3